MDLMNHDSMVESLLGCLEDTYESNQIKALNLIRKMSSDQHCPALNEERVKALLLKVFDYLYSSGNQDSLSACYLLQVCFCVPETTLKAMSTFPRIHNDVCQRALEAVSQGDVGLETVTSVYEKLALRLTQAIVYIIQHQAAKAKDDLLRASQETPLYPALLCLKYILGSIEMIHLSEWSSILKDVFCVTFEEVYPLVHPVVCHSSPEGYLPQDDEQQNTDATSERPGLPQYLIVCCWRTVREISLLYGVIMEKVLPKPSGDQLVSQQQLLQCIKVFYESILLDAKHRGAFEMAYTGYCSYWKTIWRMSKCHFLVEEFLTDSPYSMLLERDSADQLCATRRSAGLPFMVQAYLASEPKLNNHSALNKIMNQLLPISIYLPDDGELYSQTQRVHAFNVLRALYKNSSLGDAVQPFVSKGLKSAVLGCKSQVWPVRNAANQLYTALITRMFGVKHGKDDLSKQSGMAGRLFFQRYPDIHPFLLKEMESCTVFSDSSCQTLLQPELPLLLVILCKLYPSQKEGADSQSLDTFIPYLHRSASSPVYKARMLAAHALGNMVDHDAVISTFQRLSEELTVASGHNRLHGLLLQIYHLYGAISKAGNSSNISEKVGSILHSTISQNHSRILSSRCDQVKCVFIDLLTLTKPLLVTLYKANITSILQSSVNLNPKDDSKRPEGDNCAPLCNSDWSLESVDLQLSRCKLLLSLGAPVFYDSSRLERLLSVTCMYEVHHMILSSEVLKKDRQLISPGFLIKLFNDWAERDTQRFSYNGAVSTDKLADVISERLTSADNSDIVTLSEDLKLPQESSSLPLLKLKASLVHLRGKKSAELADIVAQLLEHLRGNDVTADSQSTCLEIVSLVSRWLLKVNDTVPVLECELWQVCILLLFSSDDDIRKEASETIYRITMSNQSGDHSLYQANDPNETLSDLLDWMRSVYSIDDIRSMCNLWLNDEHLWLPEADMNQDDMGDSEDRLFSRAEIYLLCDLHSFRNIVSEFSKSL